MCRTWEKDPYPKKVQNPYTCDSTEVSSEAEVRKQLAKEEEERLKGGGIAHHITSADAFLSMALDIEIAQHRLRRLVKNISSTTARQETGITEQRNQLRSRIRTWELLVPIYIPGLMRYQSNLARQTQSPDIAEHPENMTLWLPSRLPANIRSSICIQGLPHMEERLRTSQCYDALDAIRNMLKLKSRLAFWRNKNVRGQREGTRSRAVIDRAHERVRIAVDKYRNARKWKLELTGQGDWELILRELKDEDVRGYEEVNKKKPKGRRGVTEDGVTAVMDETDDVDTSDEPSEEQDNGKKTSSGETRRVLSWIWLMESNGPSKDEGDAILRVEWVKSRARSARATEEVLLLQEEMRRTLMYLSWKRKWWLSQIGLRPEVPLAMQEGLVAVSNKQASQLFALANKFQQMWQAPLGSFATSDMSYMDSNVDGDFADTEVIDEDIDNDNEDELEEVMMTDPDLEVDSNEDVYHEDS